MTIRIPKLTAEHFFGMFLILFWGQDILFSYIRAVLVRIPYIKYVADYALPFLMLTCLLLAIPYFLKIISLKDILFTSLVAITFLSHIFLYPENESLQSVSATFFTKVFPLYFIGLRFEVSKHWRLLYSMSVINIWIFMVYYILLGDSTYAGNQDVLVSYIHRAYILLPQLLVVAAEFFKKANILNVLTSIVGLILLLMCGNRGSVLMLMIFLVFCILFISEKKKRLGVYIGVIAVCAVVLYYFEFLIGALTVLFLRFGMSTRVFQRLLDGSFFISHGRNSITEICLDAISESPILGHGLTADYTITGSYAHNYALELWIDFGLIVGSFLLLATIYVVFKAWLVTKEKLSKMFLLMLICSGLLKLFVTNSFLQEDLFFMLLGVCIATLRKNKLCSGE